MFSALFRFVKRLGVLLPVLIVAYVSIFNVFPWFNDHLPAVFAVLVTYVLGAYIFVPAIIRIVRLFLPAKHLPTYCVTADGFASDPLNIAVIATREQMRAIMRKADWHEADRLNIKNGLRLILSTIYGWNYPRGPISKLYLFGRQQDLSFQAPDDKGHRGSRHHVRFWAATRSDIATLEPHAAMWRELAEQLSTDRVLWIGAASRDIGVTFIRHNAQLTHLVDPDTDGERDLLIANLTALRSVTRYRSVRLRSPYKLSNIRGLKPHLRTDGRMIVLEVTAKGLGLPKPLR